MKISKLDFKIDGHPPTPNYKEFHVFIEKLK